MKVVVVGFTHAGIAAVEQVLTTYPEAEITVYERQAKISYLSCATYLHIEGTIPELSDAMYADPADFEKQGVTMALQHDVINIDSNVHTLLVQDLITKQMATTHYDKLIMTTGSITAIPAITGIENPKVLLCKTYDQAHDLCQHTVQQRRIAIIGGSYVGVELAEAYINSGHQVLLLQQTAHLLNKYVEPLIADQVADVLVEKGVQVVTNAQVTAFADTADDQLLVTTKQGDFVVDMAAMSAGMVPQTDLLEGQIAMAANGAILTDDYMQTSDPDILAAGDAAASHFNPTKSNVYAPLASQAVRQGALAGMNVGERRLRSIGTQISTGMMVFGHTVVGTGLTLASAQAAQRHVAHVVYTGAYRPEFMLDAVPVTVELIYDRNNRQVLGAQLMSEHDVSQAANTVSAFMQNGGTIDQLAFLDMLFSPNFNQPFNYLNLAAQLAVKQENGYLRT
ncbi:NADH oxidase [Lactiplantibacillus fabifermentans T30PCM01]|uniref:NADH oxidase n=1 Tax=Lactiplantibacillus fabifermentans T30PCM01 TaxID=1400520 RepID=W6T659_9LACO|nr:FAD-dependent oxidoreductase [Lactiplantibacillus fabifermentans]ETY73479.1 NADH oxidase [Lactiplantibacillus fabifermentans T30PCM01]